MEPQNKTEKEILDLTNSTIEGLTTKEVEERQKQGKNVLPKAKKTTVFKIIIDQLLDPIIYILLASIIFSFVLKEYIDGIFIIFVVLIDTVLGTIQEWRANKSADKLQELIKVNVSVLRDGEWKEVESEELVVGDIVKLESGNKISADIRLLRTSNLVTNEAVLTGESIGSEKTNLKVDEESNAYKNMAYMGTTVLTGRGLGVVTSIGINTEFGKIAGAILLDKNEKSPLVIRMEKFTKQISYIVIVIALIITIALVARDIISNTTINWGEIFLSVVALSVSAIPEGLPIALTLALTIASNKMATKNVIVKKLNAVESLGSCTVIASDKTGTLTLNEQTARQILLPSNKMYEITGQGYNSDGQIECFNEDHNQVFNIARCGLLNNEAMLAKHENIWESFGDSIDIAFIAMAYKAGIEQKYKQDTEIVTSIPYESEKQYSAVFYKEENKVYCTVKGSPEKIVTFCDYVLEDGIRKPIDIKKIKQQNEDLASDGYRVIAVAISDEMNKKDEYNEDEISKLTLLGLVGFIDPMRKETIPAIEECISAGIKVVMITGDHPLTAFKVAKDLKMVESLNEVALASEMEKYYEKGPKEFDKYIKDKKVFSRVSPTQKVNIIESLKRQGEFVAVTGDGVNDAPAMKRANIGVAMGSGTDVVKESGTMIIIDDNFLSIVSGIEEGRVAYANIRKVIYLLISCGIAEVLFFLLSILLGLELPLLAIQLIWLNLVTDGLQDMALSFEQKEEGIMQRKPRSPNEKIFDKELLSEVLLAGTYMGIVVTGVWYYLTNTVNGAPLVEPSTARSYILMLMVFMQNIHTFNCRSEYQSVFKMPIKNNYFVLIAVIGTLLLQLIVTQIPLFDSLLGVDLLPFLQIGKIFLLALPILFIMEIYKYFKRKKMKQVK